MADPADQSPATAPASPQTGRFVRLWGGQCHILTRGQGQPVLLVHGCGGAGEEILRAFPETDGIRWIAPDRPGYGRSDALPGRAADPATTAGWLADLMKALGLGTATVVAHSLSAGSASILAATRPDLVGRLVLLAPFCRPTPHRWMPGLRLAVAPVVGGVVRRRLLPRLLRSRRGKILRAYTRPNPPPPWLGDLPIAQLMHPRAVVTMADELLQFNEGMRQVQRGLRLTVPVLIIHGLQDRTADPRWHLPWLAARTEAAEWVLIPRVGHAIHHAAQPIVLDHITRDLQP